MIEEATKNTSNFLFLRRTGFGAFLLLLDKRYDIWYNIVNFTYLSLGFVVNLTFFGYIVSRKVVLQRKKLLKWGFI